MEVPMEITSNRPIAGWNETKLRNVAAGLAFVSELIHLWILPSEFVIAPLRGLFFALVATCQGLLAVSLLFGPGRWTLRFGMLLNTAVVTVWAMTRFTSFFIFPPLLGFTRLPVGVLDLVAVLGAITLLILLAKLRRNVVPQNRRQRGQ
jgi:hypothetical protein